VTIERELLITGIGGQGVQLAAQVIARAATLEGRDVMFFGVYGGMMRGGPTDSTVVVANGAITTPPVVARAWSAIAMHDAHWPPIEGRMRSNGVALVNEATFSSEIDDRIAVHRVRASQLAAELSNPLGASMVMVGAYGSLTGLVELESLIAAMRASMPSYRTQHADANERCLRAGWELLPHRGFPAWERSGAHSGVRA
jgi:Pyruvate/2-oxoacid:ferredoxin oxidoreductase gamma subunit